MSALNFEFRKKIVFLLPQRSLGRVARHWSAKPGTPVRVWKRPPKKSAEDSADFFVFQDCTLLALDLSIFFFRQKKCFYVLFLCCAKEKNQKKGASATQTDAKNCNPRAKAAKLARCACFKQRRLLTPTHC